MKKTKKLAEAHTSRTQRGMGDFYGTGIRQNVGRVRDSYLIPTVKTKNVGKPPKSLA